MERSRPCVIQIVKQSVGQIDELSMVAGERLLVPDEVSEEVY